MTSYLYILGRTPKLALLELKTFIPDAEQITDGVAGAGIGIPIRLLGGTIKIAETIGTIPGLTAENIAPLVDSSTFGLSFYTTGPKPTRDFLNDIKTILAAGGRHVRFVESRDGKELSSVVIQKQHVQDYVVIQKEGEYIVGKTLEVQPFEDWNRRDYARPYADPKAGMLPPKVSRMVVNIADRNRDPVKQLSQKTLLDPFCGMGTVLSEAMVMGWNVVGSDQSPEVLDKCRANLRWITEQKLCTEGITYRLQTVDAVHASDAVDAGSIDAIVTEPFMGPPTVKDVKNTIKGLEKLYIGCLRDWIRVLKPHGTIVIGFPVYDVGGKTYFVKKVIDKCEMLGYTIVTGPIEYSRPGATVKRNFFILQKI